MARYSKPERPMRPPKARSFRCPGDLPDEAARFWRTTAPKLLKMGVLTDLDRAAFTGLCLSYAAMRQAAIDLDRIGSLVPDRGDSWKRNPAHSIYKANAELFLRFCTQFGLSPLSRQRVDSDPAGEQDEFERILDGVQDENKR